MSGRDRDLKFPRTIEFLMAFMMDLSLDIMSFFRPYVFGGPSHISEIDFLIAFMVGPFADLMFFRSLDI